jgi:hypothetical protein
MSATPDEQSDRREFLLARLRCASLHLRLAEANLNSVGVGLKGGWVTTEQAWQWLHELGATPLVEHGAE